MASQSIVLGVPQLQRRLHAISGPKAGRSLMQTLALSTVREAKLLVPRKTGNLGRSIHISHVDDNSAKIVASANYAAPVERGSKPHVIVPRTRKALRWAATAAGRRLTGSPRKAALRGGLGGVRFAKRVRHPGTKAQPFMLPGAKKAISGAGLASTIIKNWNDAA